MPIQKPSTGAVRSVASGDLHARPVAQEQNLSLEQAQSLVASINKANGGDVATVEKVFSQEGIPTGWTGVVLKSPGQDGGKAVAFITPDPDRRLVLGGLVVDQSGKDFVKTAYDMQIGGVLQANLVNPQGNDAKGVPGDEPKIDVAKALSALKGFDAVATKKGKGTLFVFADAQCHACKSMWLTVKQAGASNALNGVGVKWLPVAILGDQSALLGAHLLTLDNHQAADFENSLTIGGGNGKTNFPTPPANAIQALQANQALYGIVLGSFPKDKPAGTPLLVWKTADGIKASSGSVEINELKEFMGQIIP